MARFWPSWQLLESSGGPARMIPIVITNRRGYFKITRMVDPRRAGPDHLGDDRFAHIPRSGNSLTSRDA